MTTMLPPKLLASVVLDNGQWSKAPNAGMGIDTNGAFHVEWPALGTMVVSNNLSGCRIDMTFEVPDGQATVSVRFLTEKGAKLPLNAKPTLIYKGNSHEVTAASNWEITIQL